MPSDLTVGQFVYVIRKRIKLSPEKAIFIFVDEVLPPTAALMSSIYEEHKDEDGYVSPHFFSYSDSPWLLTAFAQVPLHHLLGREHVRLGLGDANPPLFGKNDDDAGVPDTQWRIFSGRRDLGL